MFIFLQTLGYVYRNINDKTMRRNNVVIVPAKCQHTGKMYGIRSERRDDGWHMNWAFELSEEEVERENFEEESISGQVVIDPEYPGCPYCGGNGFVRCGKCGKLSCWGEEGALFSCQHCGHTSKIGMSTNKFDDIKAGGF